MMSAQAPVFEALIMPHRSLSRRGVISVVAVLMILSSTVALRFWLLGAWPVMAFCLLESPLVLLLLIINLRHARASELIMLTASDITIIRTDHRGNRRQMSLPSAWLRIDLQEVKGSSRVVVSSHGRSLEVGAFLHEPDRLSLFRALSDVAHGIRNPNFENPQLQAQQV